MRAFDDWQLIHQYVESRSEPAFAELTRRHLAWVYWVALRQVGQPQMAEDVAQAVFVLLARKAASLRSGALGGGLSRTTCFVSKRALRGEIRRRQGEQTALSMNAAAATNEMDEAAWERLAPHLEQAVAALSEDDRAAILLRFYEKKPLQEVGRRLDIGEEAARKRVSRAVEKMRAYLVRRGLTLAGALLVTFLAEKTVQAAPADLASRVLKAVAVAASGSAALPELARAALRAWRWAAIEVAAGVAAVSLALILASANKGWFTRQPARLDSANGAAPSNNPAAAPRVITGATRAARVNNNARIGKIGAITGRVLDDRGNPVANAKVWGGISSVPFASDMTDESGQFALDKTGGPSYVTVTADGFAADQQAFDPTHIAGPLVFHLSQVPPLEVRLVDEEGRGIADARLFLFHWWGGQGTLAENLPEQSDAEGRLRWLSPPKGELELQFGKIGFRISVTNKFAADGKEHLIVLHPATALTGGVTDAETGAPVSNFQFTLGHSQPWNPDDPIPMWDFKSQPGSNGFYKTTIEEEQRAYLRIEAEGYATVETEVHLTNGLQDVFDIQLQRPSEANSIRGTVFQPDGTPAVGIEVALCTADVGVMLRGTAFASNAFGNINPSRSPEYRRKTDEQGAFVFNPMPGAHTVVAVSAMGLGQAHCLDYAKPLVIRLEAWGRIEGSVRTLDGRWANRKLQWESLGRLSSWMTLEHQEDELTTHSDANGNFVFEHIAPGGGRLEIDDDPGVTSALSSLIQVNPGETARAQVGGRGRPLTGQLVAPANVEIRSWSNQVVTARLANDTDSYPIPSGLTDAAANRWKLQFSDTAEGKAWLGNSYAYNFQVREDGSFFIPEVLPGKYSMFFMVAQGSLGSGTDLPPRYLGFDPNIAEGWRNVEIPEATGDGAPTINVGKIVLYPMR